MIASHVRCRLFTTYAVNMVLFLVEPVGIPVCTSRWPLYLIGDIGNSGGNSDRLCGGDVMHHRQPLTVEYPPDSARQGRYDAVVATESVWGKRVYGDGGDGVRCIATNRPVVFSVIMILA